MRLDPQPDPSRIAPISSRNYWFAPDRQPPAAWKRLYRRLVLRDHVRFVERALRDFGARGPLLDVGCGGGLFLGMMRERGFRVVGLDNSREAPPPSPGAARRARGSAPIWSTRRSRRGFAGITMFHVLEHLPTRAPISPRRIACWRRRDG
jgi:2-polyprenyl-3-methyl-5-hydroxy-6-metoxy-1,4-benzoquinol methylase